MAGNSESKNSAAMTFLLDLLDAIVAAEGSPFNDTGFDKLQRKHFAEGDKGLFSRQATQTIRPNTSEGPVSNTSETGLEIPASLKSRIRYTPSGQQHRLQDVLEQVVLCNFL